MFEKILLQQISCFGTDGTIVIIHNMSSQQQQQQQKIRELEHQCNELRNELSTVRYDYLSNLFHQYQLAAKNQKLTKQIEEIKDEMYTMKCNYEARLLRSDVHQLRTHMKYESTFIAMCSMCNKNIQETNRTVSCNLCLTEYHQECFESELMWVTGNRVQCPFCKMGMIKK